MRMKTLAMLAVSGLMAASIAYVLPAYAEDPAGDIDGAAPMQLAMGDDTSDNGSGATDNSNAGGAAGTTDSSAAGSSNAPANSGATSDQPSGDDDY